MATADSYPLQVTCTVLVYQPAANAGLGDNVRTHHRQAWVNKIGDIACCSVQPLTCLSVNTAGGNLEVVISRTVQVLTVSDGYLHKFHNIAVLKQECVSVTLPSPGLE